MKPASSSLISSIHLVFLLGIGTNAAVQIGCTKNKINTTEQDAAVRDLGNICETKGPITQSMKISWTAGKVRAYACNYSMASPNPCTTAEIEAALCQVRALCGDGMSGWWYDSDWLKGYGIEALHVDWCASID
ncbi:hypothetical protein B0H66DRAFT_273481 [Apodospora peruviana]|uniref:Secreted protein n=1 Tax=Apodospora peruviana TaxID=516989 RepID=A0AAE0HZU9_9PEZI|nr:hypothetical protein B0H66DRAFT_273481 [Apodospora peruviana]